MVMVCKEHVAEGLHLLPIPHVKEISKYEKIPCYFCEQPATIQLFVFNYLKEQGNIGFSKQTIQNV